MKFEPLPMAGAWVVSLEPFEDARGTFCRLFCSKEMRSIGFTKGIRQINKSSTAVPGTVRGLHFQHPPMAEVKMVQCTRGRVYDVMVDIRRDSDTFLRWHGETLREDSSKMVIIPEGFAHGFQALEPNAELLYFTSEYYSREHEGGLRYDDSRIGIKWPREVTAVSEKDSAHALLVRGYDGIII